MASSGPPPPPPPPGTLGIAYIYSPRLCANANALPSNLGRSQRVHSLHFAALARAFDCIDIVEPIEATRGEMAAFHEKEFIDALLTAERGDRPYEELNKYGLTHDCPVFDGLADYVQLVAGGALTAARLLASRKARVAIHWDGGRHHAHADHASGFCYVNDIVLAILKLHEKGLKRVLYIDLDIHHCDGVESAFEYTSKVFRVSFHIHELGFFPGTGAPTYTGTGKGRGHALNIPLPPTSTTSTTFLASFRTMLARVLETDYPKPSAIVVQCGLDGCRGDPLVSQGWKLDSFAIGDCIVSLLDAAAETPLLLMGGGGYANSMAARGWAYTTLRVVEKVGGQCVIDEIRGGKDWTEVDLPEHAFLGEYGPEYTLYSE